MANETDALMGDTTREMTSKGPGAINDGLVPAVDLGTALDRFDAIQDRIVSPAQLHPPLVGGPGVERGTLKRAEPPPSPLEYSVPEGSRADADLPDQSSVATDLKAGEEDDGGLPHGFYREQKNSVFAPARRLYPGSGKDPEVAREQIAAVGGRYREGVKYLGKIAKAQGTPEQADESIEKAQEGLEEQVDKFVGAIRRYEEAEEPKNPLNRVDLVRKLRGKNSLAEERREANSGYWDELYATERARSSLQTAEDSAEAARLYPSEYWQRQAERAPELARLHTSARAEREPGPLVNATESMQLAFTMQEFNRKRGITADSPRRLPVEVFAAIYRDGADNSDNELAVETISSMQEAVIKEAGERGETLTQEMLTEAVLTGLEIQEMVSAHSERGNIRIGDLNSKEQAFLQEIGLVNPDATIDVYALSALKLDGLMWTHRGKTAKAIVPMMIAGMAASTNSRARDILQIAEVLFAATTPVHGETVLWAHGERTVKQTPDRELGIERFLKVDGTSARLDEDVLKSPTSDPALRRAVLAGKQGAQKLEEVILERLINTDHYTDDEVADYRSRMRRILGESPNPPEVGKGS